jgi:hypothetical protein
VIRIFTKKVFDLSAHDQIAVVDAALRELDGCWLNQEDEDRAKRKRQRIERKAVLYGVWQEVK